VMLAVGAAFVVAMLAYLVAHHGRWVFAITGLAMIGLLEVVALAGRPPHRLPRRVVWRLGCWPRLCWTDRLFLGWSRGRTHRWRWAMARREDSVGFTHDPEIPFMLPGLAPTGRRVGIPTVVVMGFTDGRLPTSTSTGTRRRCSSRSACSTLARFRSRARSRPSACWSFPLEGPADRPEAGRGGIGRRCRLTATGEWQ
jgi:hypothetical protein